MIEKPVMLLRLSEGLKKALDERFPASHFKTKKCPNGSSKKAGRDKANLLLSLVCIFLAYEENMPDVVELVKKFRDNRDYDGFLRETGVIE